jgi:hypothetical protein
MAGTVAAGPGGREASGRGLWITGEAMGELAPPVCNCRGLVEEFDELPAARYRLQPQGDEHYPMAPAQDRDRIH